MRYIDIEVLMHNDSTKLMDSLDMDFDFINCDVQMIRIYEISLAMPYINNDVEYTRIFVGGQTFISPLRFNDFKKLITLFG